MTTVINRMWTISNLPTTSAGGSVNMSHFCNLTLDGRQADAGVWVRLMSNPSNCIVRERVWARSTSQILENGKCVDFLMFACPNYPVPVATSAIRELSLGAGMSGWRLNWSSFFHKKNWSLSLQVYSQLPRIPIPCNQNQRRTASLLDSPAWVDSHLLLLLNSLEIPLQSLLSPRGVSGLSRIEDPWCLNSRR